MKKKEINICDEANKKMSELLTCGNERVELAAAKEIISAFSKTVENDDNEINLKVTIKIV